MTPKLRAMIRAAFPDVRYLGKITPADDLTSGEDEDYYDDERILLAELGGKSWTEIPRPVLASLAYDVPLLTFDAFRAFLPAWLDLALEDSEIREPMVYLFSDKERGGDTSFMDRRMEVLTKERTKTLSAVLAYLLETEDSNFLKEHEECAIAYVRKFE